MWRVAQDRVGHKAVSDEFREFVHTAIEELPPTNGIYSEQMEWANAPPTAAK